MHRGSFKSVLIIYNPISTSGKAHLRAKRLLRQLAKKHVTNVKVIASDYPGHAEELAHREALIEKRPLIISVSGDGGYNEVINGSLKAQLSYPRIQPVCAILAAGNANDHRKAVAKKPLLKAVIDGTTEPMDVLCLQFGNTVRYAHSYIGVGVTANTAADLQADKNTRWKELKVVTRNLLKFDQFSIVKDGRNRQLDSLVFANIHRMSKVLKLNDKTNLQDGLFNLIVVPHRTRFKFIFLAFKLAVFGAKNPPQLSSYTFQLTKPQLGQLDGEVIALPAHTDITVCIKPKLLLTLR